MITLPQGWGNGFEPDIFGGGHGYSIFYDFVFGCEYGNGYDMNHWGEGFLYGDGYRWGCKSYPVNVVIY